MLSTEQQQRLRTIQNSLTIKSINTHSNRVMEVDFTFVIIQNTADIVKGWIVMVGLTWFLQYGQIKIN